MPTCCVRRCRRQALYAVRINVPAAGRPIDTHQPLTALSSILLCERCFALQAEPHNLRAMLGDPDDEDSVAQMICSMGMVGGCPDFERAWISKVELSSVEYKEFTAVGRSGDGRWQ